MTISDSTGEWMALLAEEAKHRRPRLFTIYGVSRSRGNREILGWGMSFEDDGQALFYIPDSRQTHRARSPEGIRKLLALVADVELSWLDGT
jgi:hypothetical protein